MTPVFGNGATLSGGSRLSRARAHYAAVVVAMSVLGWFWNLPGFLYIHDNALLPRFTDAAMFVASMPLVLWHWREALSSLAHPFAIFWVLLIALNLAHGVLGGEETFRIGILRAQNALATLQLYLLLRVAGLDLGARLLGFALFGAAGSVIANFLLPGVVVPLDAEGYFFGRAAGFYINPNDAATAICLLLFLFLLLAPLRLRVLAVLVSGLAILLTFSRGGALIWMAILVLGTLAGRLPRNLLLVPPLVLLALYMLRGSITDEIAPFVGLDGGLGTGWARVESLFEGDLRDQASDERWTAAGEALDLFQANLILGAGPGASLGGSGIGTHNQSLLIGAEYGLLGLALWCLLLAGLLDRARATGGQQAAAVLSLTLALSFLSHNLFDLPVWQIWFAIWGAAAVRRGGP